MSQFNDSKFLLIITFIIKAKTKKWFSSFVSFEFKLNTNSNVFEFIFVIMQKNAIDKIYLG